MLALLFGTLLLPFIRYFYLYQRNARTGNKKYFTSVDNITSGVLRNIIMCDYSFSIIANFSFYNHILVQIAI